jgi:hypothetical protein
MGDSLKTSAAPHTFNVIAENFNIHPKTKRNHTRTKLNAGHIFKIFEYRFNRRAVLEFLPTVFHLLDRVCKKVMQLRIQ